MFVPDALSLVSIGGVQSDHTRQVAAVAAKMGLKAALVQEHWVECTDPGYDKVGNIQPSRLMAGAETRLDPSSFGIEHKGTLAALQEELVPSGAKPYYVPAGEPNEPNAGGTAKPHSEDING